MLLLDAIIVNPTMRGYDLIYSVQFSTKEDVIL